MSMDINHYVGWFFECTPLKPMNPHYVFPDEEFFRVLDAGGSEVINNKHIFIPNRKTDNCFHLDRFSPTGIFEMTITGGFDVGSMKQAGDILHETYGGGNVHFKYGIIVYAN